jgi:hypothetical protein
MLVEENVESLPGWGLYRMKRECGVHRRFHKRKRLKMKSVIYLEEGQFKLVTMQDWLSLLERYKFKASQTAKYIDMDLSLFEAMTGYAFTKHAQNVLRELYYGN